MLPRANRRGSNSHEQCSPPNHPAPARGQGSGRGKTNIQRVDACAETRLRIVTINGALDEAALRAAGVEAVIKLPDHVVHLLTGLNADQYAAEMRGQLAKN